MKAVTWQGYRNMSVENVPDPRLINPRDAVIRITSTAICGSDLHLYGGFIPTMQKGDIVGHEFMGEVVEVGRGVKNLHSGDKVVIPFTISCGNCFHCHRKEYSACDNSNPNAEIPESIYGGQSAAGLFGYSHMYGGYAGGQAEYVRVPYADFGALKVPREIDDDKVLFLSDILPTAYMAAENCNIRQGDTVAIWGCGPVGLLAIKCAYILGAERVIAIDRLPERLRLASSMCGAEVINYEKENIQEELKLRTNGRGPDSCIDAVGLEAHGTGIQYAYDVVKTNMMLETDRPVVLREVLLACRKGGTVSIPGVYGGLLDKIPFGAAFTKGLTLKMGQTHVQKYMRPLLDLILKDVIDPSFVISHRIKLTDAPNAYASSQRKDDDCIKFVIKN